MYCSVGVLNQVDLQRGGGGGGGLLMDKVVLMAHKSHSIGGPLRCIGVNVQLTLLPR